MDLMANQPEAKSLPIPGMHIVLVRKLETYYWLERTYVRLVHCLVAE